MRALAVDTSTNMCGIAVADEHALLAEYMLNDRRSHSQKLVSMLKEILDSLCLKPSDIDVFAAITGPGSFTGLRIGITTVKALAYAVQKPVVGITSLDALAYSVTLPEDILVCPMLDARNNQVYTAIYKAQNGLMVNTSGYMGIHVSELVKKFEENTAQVIFTGDASAIHKDFLKIELGERCIFQPDFMLQRMAAPAAKFSITQAYRGETLNGFELLPFYLRPSQAEREYEKKHSCCGTEGL